MEGISTCECLGSSGKPSVISPIPASATGATSSFLSPSGPSGVFEPFSEFVESFRKALPIETAGAAVAAGPLARIEDKVGGYSAIKNRASCVLLDARSTLLFHRWEPFDAWRTGPRHPELWPPQLPLLVLGTKLEGQAAVPRAVLVVVLWSRLRLGWKWSLTSLLTVEKPLRP